MQYCQFLPALFAAIKASSSETIPVTGYKYYAGIFAADRQTMGSTIWLMAVFSWVLIF